MALKGKRPIVQIMFWLLLVPVFGMALLMYKGQQSFDVPQVIAFSIIAVWMSSLYLERVPMWLRILSLVAGAGALLVTGWQLVDSFWISSLPNVGRALILPFLGTVALNLALWNRLLGFNMKGLL
jgi:hypothetical protein